MMPNRQPGPRHPGAINGGGPSPGDMFGNQGNAQMQPAVSTSSGDSVLQRHLESPMNCNPLGGPQHRPPQGLNQGPPNVSMGGNAPLLMSRLEETPSSDPKLSEINKVSSPLLKKIIRNVLWRNSCALCAVSIALDFLRF